MPLDLGYYASRFIPTGCLVPKTVILNDRLFRWATYSPVWLSPINWKIRIVPYFVTIATLVSRQQNGGFALLMVLTFQSSLTNLLWNTYRLSANNILNWYYTLVFPAGLVNIQDRLGRNVLL